MKNKFIFVAITLVIFCILISGCDTDNGKKKDTIATQSIANKLQTKQPTPTDIDYSLERYNLIRRAYWVNGQRERANTLLCEVNKPLGYVVLISDNGTIINKFIVDGKISSLNSFLTPDSEYYESTGKNEWLPDIDGSYGTNDNGIFFFTPNGNYIEWNGKYLYSDVPFEIDNPIVNYKEANNE